MFAVPGDAVIWLRAFKGLHPNPFHPPPRLHMLTKRILPWLFAACLSQTTVGTPPAKAAASGANGGALDVNFFYDNLKDDGSWFNTTEYGDVWQPYIAYKSDSWRPYTDGYWSYTDGGWMFVSYEDFGWAVYHYGRWTQLKDIGWAWVPGTEWAPAWVTWRESNPDGSAAQPAPAGAQPTPAIVSATTTDAPPAPDQGNGAPPPPAARRGGQSRRRARRGGPELRGLGPAATRAGAGGLQRRLRLWTHRRRGLRD